MNIIKEFENLISKYGGINQFEKKATQSDKEKYFLLNRELEISFKHKIPSHGNMIDSFVIRFLTENDKINEIVIKEDDLYFSLFTKKKFMGKSNIINPESFRLKEFEKTIEFDSLFQFLVFHKSILFLDKDSAKETSNTDKRDKLISINKKINNYNKLVWTEFRTKILEVGIQNYFNSQPSVYEKFLNLKNDIFIFESNFDNWGVINSQEFLENEINSQFNYKNYFGKILTKLKSEKK